MTVEELEVLVTAKTEEAVKELEKIIPSIKQATKQVQEAFSKIDTKTMQNKLQQVVQFAKKKAQELKRSTEKNEIAIKVTNNDARSQVTQLEKEIDSLQKKISGRELKLNITNDALDKMRYDTNQQVVKEMPNAGAKRIGQQTELRLLTNDNYMNLVKQSDKLNNEIIRYNALLDGAKSKMAQLSQETQKTGATQSKLSSFFSAFKQKLEQAKPTISKIGGAVGSIGKAFSSVGSQIGKIFSSLKKKTSGIGGGFKGGLKHVLKYAGALLSIRGIYGLLKGTANAWLSSQNAGAKQLSANIDYMKYAMGSALAPIIQWVTNLVYQLMRAIQSVAYALTGVNIFAKASAKSYASMAGNAKKAKEETKQLAGVHDEINNIQDNKNSDSGSNTATPSFDLSEINPNNSIIEAIKNGNWYEIGATLGEKLNDAMNSIPWDKIQNTARTIGTNIAQFLNGFIAKTDWVQVGNTFAQGLNTIIYFGYSFVTTFDWKKFGIAISDRINGFFSNVDWATAGQLLGEGIKGILNTISTALQEINWAQIGQDIVTFITNVDWNGIISGLCSGLGSAIGGASALIASILLEGIIYPLADFFLEKTEECGGNVVLGILKGIVDGLIGIGEWIYNNLVYPLIEAFCNALGIHSPSTVFAEFGQNIIQGLFNGISSLVNNITQIWQKMKSTAIEAFSNIKTSITNKVTEIKNGITNTFQKAYDGITNIFRNIGKFFSGIWSNVKNTFSNLGTSIGNAISSSVKSGINGVISLIERTINSAINLINNAIGVINLIPGVNVGRIGRLSLPRLAKGGVLTEATAVIAGEYSGAKSNPEIVTPQNIMYDTMRRALEDTEFHNSNNGQPIYLTIMVGNKKLGQILLDDLRDRKRQTGKDIEALVGG